MRPRPVAGVIMISPLPPVVARSPRLSGLGLRVRAELAPPEPVRPPKPLKSLSRLERLLPGGPLRQCMPRAPGFAVRAWPAHGAIGLRAWPRDDGLGFRKFPTPTWATGTSNDALSRASHELNAA